MSRGQQGNVYSQEQAVQKGYNTNANTSFNTAQQDVDSYGNAVGKFQAANPYVEGGQVETSQNQQIADTAAAGSEAAGQALQGQAVRTGQNASGAIAATKQMEEANQRNLSGEEANATLGRVGAGVGYNEAGVGMQGTQEGMEDTLAQQQGNLAQGAANTEEQAAQTPSFMDELGGGLASALAHPPPIP